MPSPSVEPIHAATNAEDRFNWVLMIIGRPENNNTTHFVTRLHTSETSVASVLLSARVLVSPLPSAYGVSPTATIPTSPLYFPFVRVPTQLSFTVDDSPACWI